MSSFENVPYRVVLDENLDKPELVFPTQVSRNLITGAFLNINWLRYRVGRPLCVPLKLGALFRRMRP